VDSESGDVKGPDAATPSESTCGLWLWIHHCLGASLARLEGQEAFKALAERFPSLQLATEELGYQPSITFRSLKSLPVTWN